MTNSNTLMTSDISSGKSAIREDMQGVENSTKVLQALIDMEARELGDSGKSRIMIGGFSQGGAIALNSLLMQARLKHKARVVEAALEFPSQAGVEETVHQRVFAAEHR